ncbi:MAG: PspC domain-containing protein [Eubacterium sp.]|nr:PspC domain-containing protein [Eubacterium sp.]
MEPKKLVKSNQNRLICGVCGGIAQYFGLDATLIRLGWVIFSVIGGSGILAYIIAAIIMPPEY